MRFEPGKIVETLKLKDGKEIDIKFTSLEYLPKIVELVNPIVKEDYIHDRHQYNSIEDARRVYEKAIDDSKKGRRSTFLGFLDGKLILIANYFLTKIKKGKYKGKYSMEVGISIKKEYRKRGIGGKMFDFLVKIAKERKDTAYVMGRFYHENFSSLVLCKSRKLKIYRVDKNKPPYAKKWQKDFFKWNRPFDRVNARIFIE